MSKPKILVIEDESSLREILSYNLTREGYDVVTSADGQDGLKQAQNLIPDLVLLDLMLPRTDGLQVCRELRADPRTKRVRILMLTSMSEEVDEIVGFSMGADDYVTKPFKLKPLLHRVKALLRRAAPGEADQDAVSEHGITVDRLNHKCAIDGAEVLLTPTEFLLLWTLVRSPGRPFRRNELMDICRGEDANALERTIDVHVRSLRQKLAGKADLIETVRGIGYRLRME